MDDRTYRRMTWGCQCGHVARSAVAEARHRHNFPMLCKRPREPKTKPLTLSKPGGKIPGKETRR